MNFWESLTVLVVDDEPMLRATVRFEIEMLGCVVIEAGSGREAKNLIDKSPVDLIVSDIRMPDGDGIELLKHVKKGKADIPMFLMSGFADISPWDAYDLGAEAYIGKPFYVEQLEYFLLQAKRSKAMSWDQAPAANAAIAHELKSSEPFALGRGGIFIANSGLTLRKDMIVNFALSSPLPQQTARLEGVGTVRWVRAQATEQLPAGCGIEFVSLKKESLACLQDAFQTGRPQAYIPRSLPVKH